MIQIQSSTHRGDLSSAPSGGWYWLAAAFPAVCLCLILRDVSLLRACALFVLIGVPLIDLALGTQPHRTRPPLCADALLPSAAFLHAACVLVGVAALAMRPFGFGSVVDACALGVCSAIGLSLTHTCCHARSRPVRVLGQCLNALSAQLQAPFEHKHHHATYASASDPATAARGESFYRFAPRYYWATYRYLADTQTSNAGGRGTAWWRRRALWFPIIPASIGLTLGMALGPVAALYFVLQAMFATTILELGAFVTHYGLERSISSDGKVERASVAHSWNDSHFLSKFLLLGASEHSHHHKRPDAPFWLSESNPAWPQLPAPYSMMVLAGLVPPLFRRWMDPLLPATGGTHKRSDVARDVPPVLA